MGCIERHRRNSGGEFRAREAGVERAPLAGPEQKRADAAAHIARIDIESPYPRGIIGGGQSWCGWIIRAVRPGDRSAIAPSARADDRPSSRRDEVSPVADELPIHPIGMIDRFLDDGVIIGACVQRTD